MENTLTNLFVSAKDVFQQEGPISLLRRGFTFAAGLLSRYIFRYENYFLVEYPINTMMRGKHEADYMPRIQSVTARIVTTLQQVDQLAADGFDFLDYWTDIRRRLLEKGAIACCIFVGQELANMGWVAMTQEAKDELDPVPYHVDFSNREVCLGGSLTMPRYRGHGLSPYNAYKRIQLLKELGIMTARAQHKTTNMSIIKAVAKFDSKIYAKARYLRILGWRYYKEMPLR